MLWVLPLPIASACPNSQICVTCLALVGIWVCDPHTERHTTGYKSWSSWAAPLLTCPVACSPIPATINRCPMIARHPAFQVLQDHRGAHVLHGPHAGALVHLGRESVEFLLPGLHPPLHHLTQCHLAGQQCRPHVRKPALWQEHQPSAEPARHPGCHRWVWGGSQWGERQLRSSWLLSGFVESVKRGNGGE